MDMAAGRLGNPGESLYWLGRLWNWAVRHAAWTRWTGWLEQASLPNMDALPCLERRLKVQAAVMAGNFPEAVVQAQQGIGIFEEVFREWRIFLLAEGLVRSGHKKEARHMFMDLLRAMPWHVNLALKLHDLHGESQGLVEPGDDTAICLYTWNKAELLQKTLDDLAASRIGRARIVALDNGSTDGTGSVLEQAQARLGAERFGILRLPVNVGAPPARNWLLSLPEVRACRWVAFLDDDVRLPADWLARLLTTAEHYPEAGAVGCRVTYVDPPWALQMVDVHLLAPTDRERLPLLSNALGEPDLGLHAYVRRAASVTGCCHLLSRKGLERVGGFDVRYNPSQLDDLERDLRLGLARLPAVYDGSLAVAHHRKSGPGTAMTGKAGANALGNKIKLETAFDENQGRELRDFNLHCAWEDLLERMGKLKEWASAS